MSNLMLLVLSIILILSSLSEKIEIIVHNEEVLLTLCFIAFIFFAYGYLSDGIVEDFQKKVEGLEDQLFGVLSEKFSATVAYFEEIFLFKGLESKISLIEILVSSRLFSHFFSFQTRALKEGINGLTTSKLMEIIRTESAIVEQAQKQTMKSVLISLILPASSFDYLKPLKQSMVIEDPSAFFLKVSTIAK